MPKVKGIEGLVAYKHMTTHGGHKQCSNLMYGSIINSHTRCLFGLFNKLMLAKHFHSRAPCDCIISCMLYAMQSHWDNHFSSALCMLSLMIVVLDYHLNAINSLNG